MNKLSFQQKLWIPLLCSRLRVTGIYVYDAYEVRKIRIEQRSADLRNIADLGLSTIKQFGDQGAEGNISKEEAQKQATEIIKNMRFGKDGYLTITNFDGYALMNPFKPENNGKNMMNFQDANGKYMYHDIVAAGMSEAGAGFVRYVWPRPGQSSAVPKLSRVAGYKPWRWNVMVGVYMDDIDDAFQAALWKSLG